MAGEMWRIWHASRQRGELDIAHTLAVFLQWRYIEPANAVAYTTTQYESRHINQ